MCYTVIWLDKVTKQPYYSQEIASADKPTAWEQIAPRSQQCQLLAMVPGHHGVFFNSGGLTEITDCAILDTKLR